MALTSGTRLGSYEVIALLGSGGMGEVYRARDTRLARDVALKILPETVTTDPERVSRFRREAQVLASLNHHHIGAIYGLEETPLGAGSARTLTFLVLELVEGQTLAERIARGPLPADEALAIARETAEALEAAHERGIIHRDLKPANIALTADGHVKVLDFGLAKALADDSSASVSAAGSSHSPTITTPPMMTGVGVILGTPAYMAPEQAKGRSADKRSDIWAFGCVLYEMLTGKRAFEGEDLSDTLAAILRGDPDWTALPKDLSLSVAILLRRSLEKDRRRRIGDMSTALFLLDQPLTVAAPGTPEVAAARPSRWNLAIAAIALAVVAGGLGALVAWNARPSAAPPIVTRFSVALGEGVQFTNTADQVVALSPDGTRLVYVANRQLYLRSMSDLNAQPIRGTDVNPRRPMFSPDGSSIGYFSADEQALKRIAVTGGTPMTVCSLVGLTSSPASGGNWSGETIMFGVIAGPNRGILRVAAAGGKPEVIVGVNADEYADAPQMLPDGDHVLFTLSSAPAGPTRWEKAQVVVQSLKTGERKTLIDAGADGRYLTTGHILYAHGGVLYAVRLDPRTLQLMGAPVPVVEGVRRADPGGTGSAQFSVSATGSLVYVPGPVSNIGDQQMLALIDRKGVTEVLRVPAGAYRDPRVSPDGKQVAFGTDDGKEANVWLYELAGTSAIRRLTHGGQNRYPVWSADGLRVAFQSDRDGDAAIFWQRADGTGTAERLTKPDQGTAHVPESWSPDGKRLLFSATKGAAVSSALLSMDDRKTMGFDDVRSSQPINAMFSPDGKWVAYTSNSSSSSSQIYVQPFPPTGATYQITKTISNNHHPFWSPDGRELYYIPGVGQFAVVSVTTQPSFTFSEPMQLPRGQHGFIEGGPSNTRQTDATLDKRVVAVVAAGEAPGAGTSAAQLQVVVNWFEDLKARVPVK